MPLEFGLQISRFTWPGGAEEIGPRLASIAPAAEEAGFTSIWVMDHFLQIPGVGREWEEMLDSYTTLGYLAAVTSRARLGVLVTGITYRNLAHLGKIVATLDVLSGGRAMCGLGAAWFAREHKLYGWEFPPARRRYELLEDALELLPLLWGPGSPAFHGRTIDVPGSDLLPEAVAGARPDPRRWVRRTEDACVWWLATRTRATCSASRTRSATRSTCCVDTVSTWIAIHRRSRSRNCRRSTTARRTS